MFDIKRYDIDELTCLESPSGDYVIYWDLLPLIEELRFTREMAMKALDEAKALKAENAELRTRVLDWVTVTEDPITGNPATLPERMKEVLLRHNDLDPIVSWIKPNGTWGTPYTGHCEDEGLYGIEWAVDPGDRWAYIPEAQP